MATHLTITAKTPAGAAATKGFNAQGAAETDNGVMGQFAAMLNGTQPAAPATGTAETKLGSSLKQLANLLSGGAQADTPDKDTKDPEAIAAAIDATLPITAQLDAKAALTGLVNDLTALKKSLAAGEPVDPALLKRIDAALDGLGDKFKIDLAAAGGPTVEDLAAMAKSVADGDQSTTAQLTKALAPVAETLLAGGLPVADDAGTDAAPLVKTIGDKLAKLLQALNTTDASAADNPLVTSIKTQTTADTDLNAAITRLQTVSATRDPGATAPVLATPKLAMPEPILTGKSTDTATTPAPSSDTAGKNDGLQPPLVVSANAKPDSGAGGSGKDDAKAKADDKKSADSTATAAPAAAAADPRSDAQGTAQHTVQAARVDATAPRAVQAGYQTSQQQLNLPQLAFELVRQVNDGNTRFQMRLDPPELGRIDVKLDIDKSGQINARLIVDKSETLDLMQRDQRALERALQQAGLDSGKTNLEFSLKQSPFSGGQQQGRNDQSQPFNLSGTRGDDIEEAPPTINLYRASLTASGVNIIA